VGILCVVKNIGKMSLVCGLMMGSGWAPGMGKIRGLGLTGMGKIRGLGRSDWEAIGNDFRKVMGDGADSISL
jgi:hypothetical protein